MSAPTARVGGYHGSGLPGERASWGNVGPRSARQSSDDAALTLEALARRGWLVVLCWPRSKKPAALKGQPWPVARDVDVVGAHLGRGGNLGLVAGPTSRVAILDPDEPEPWAVLVRCLGVPAATWVQTGSGHHHLYVAWEPQLPAKLVSVDGEIIGECQRGPGEQHCLIPPSVHPNTGQPYTWLVDPRTEPLRPLPPPWRAWLTRERRPARPGAVRSEAGRASFTGGDRVAAALAQPGARRRPGYIKFQCPQCRAEGHDAHEDNAVLYTSGNWHGRWGCAWASREDAPRHRRAIFRALEGRSG